MFVPKAVYEILKDYPDGLTAKKITEEVIARGLHPLPAKQPVSIVTRAIHRHCIGIDRTYSCQDRFFSKSTNKQGDTVYKIAANYSTTTTAIAETFVFPQQQIAAINSSSTASGSKTRIMDAENQTVRELLGKYCFYVPAYQRSYSWKSSHTKCTTTVESFPPLYPMTQGRLSDLYTYSISSSRPSTKGFPLYSFMYDRCSL